jgi:dipeptidyl aminopeptidase/acylaminoacyl peptidase
MPHGGPHARDRWGFDPEVQWLANRGYAVLQVNFRGSSGYGKAFLDAGDRQWGRKMQEDLEDAVRWAVQQEIADPGRVAIYGGSYGGYAALAGAALSPTLFRCAVALNAPSDLQAMLRSFPAYWKLERAERIRRVGDPDDPADAARLRATSPLFLVERIEVPILLAQGARDPRVTVEQAERFVAAVAERGGRLTYALYPDEGHMLGRTENNLDFHARAEAFLASCLGGRLEPTTGARVMGSSALVRDVGMDRDEGVTPARSAPSDESR